MPYSHMMIVQLKIAFLPVGQIDKQIPKMFTFFVDIFKEQELEKLHTLLLVVGDKNHTSVCYLLTSVAFENLSGWSTDCSCLNFFDRSPKLISNVSSTPKR